MSDQNSYDFLLHKDDQAIRKINNAFPFPFPFLGGANPNPNPMICSSSSSQISSGGHENPTETGYNNNYYPKSYNSLISLSECLQGSTFADYKALSGAFDLSFNPLSEAVSLVPPSAVIHVKEEELLSVVADAAATEAAEGNYSNETAPRTPPISTVSSACSEAAGFEEETSKRNIDLVPNDQCEKEHQKSNKESKTGKKLGERKARGARFAFMTKSEVDHLEDGYRWRKYGQKAVKNSSFPRSYYRCTSQKCNVKKRVERSYEDPSFVMTTYEGQHNHHTPSILRGNATLFDTSLLSSPSSSQHDLVSHMIPSSNKYNRMNPNYFQNFDPQSQLQPPHDYTLFQQP